MGEFPEKMLDAIRAAPDDPEPYLVYADWLQAQGDPRGELISLQYRMSTTDDTGEFLRLKARAEELLAQNAEHFYGPARHALIAFNFQWRWGFVKELVMPSGYDLIDHPSCVVLRKLWIGTEELSEDLTYEIAWIAARTRTLRGLTLNVGALGYGGDLSALPASLPELRELRLDGRFTSSTWAFPELQHLNFEGYDVDETQWGHLLQTAPTSLRRLRLRGASDPDAWVTALIESELLDRLEILEIESPATTRVMIALIDRLEALPRIGVTFESEPPPLDPATRERLVRLVPEFRY